MAKSEEKQLVFVNHLQRMMKPVRFRCEVGSRTRKEYTPVYDRAGVWHLEESGINNDYLEIQSHAESCDINILMARYRLGETDVLQKVQGTYGDFTNIPTNYAELMNAKIQAENLFMSLHPDVREKYNNSVEQFMSEIGTADGQKKLMEIFGPKQTDVPVPAPSATVEEVTTE